MVPQGRFGLVTGFVVITVAACSPSPPSAVKPSQSVASPFETVLGPTPPPAQALPTLSPAPTPTVYPRLPIPAGTPRCHATQLEVGFRIFPPAAGNVLLSFEVRNRSSHACWVYGFVGFQTLDGTGHLLPQVLRWTTNSFFGRSDPPTRILLPTSTTSVGSEPGSGHAFFSVATNDVLCDTNQNPVVSMEIWPPDERQPLIQPAKAVDGRPLFFCRYLELYPLQVELSLTLS
jgi:uncharacterized protein DUF4232